jgi:endonuclease/exonuclease/phosphatase family metal-dependent hydrolase
VIGIILVIRTPRLVVWLYTGAFVVWRLALMLAPATDRYGWLHVTRLLGAWVYLPGIVLAIIALIMRNRGAWVLVIPLLWLVLEYGGLFVPSWQSLAPGVDAPVTTLRVMTWNTGSGPHDVPAFVARVRQLQPDIIALQEVNNELAPLLDRTLDELREEWPYQLVQWEDPSGHKWRGTALISRLPLVQEKSDTLPSGCRCIDVTLEWQGRPVRVIALHLIPPDYDMRWKKGMPQLAQIPSFATAHQDGIIEALVAEVSAINVPLVMLGDFNIMERQATYRRLSRLLSNAWDEAGWGFGYTFPQNSAVIRIDHIWHNGAWWTQRTWTGGLPQSDHRYVVAELAPIE